MESKKRKPHEFEVGERVMLADGREAVIEALSHNINGLPVCKVDGVWKYESEIDHWYPPCPV